MVAARMILSSGLLPPPKTQSAKYALYECDLNRAFTRRGQELTA